jgi:hypothetical protein
MKLGMLFAITFLAFPGPSIGAADGEAKGNLNYKGMTVTLKHAYFVKGPDAMDSKTILRRLILSRDDLGAAIQGCKTMKCVDGAIAEAMQVDFDAGPRLLYWITLNGDRVQYSGTAQPSAATVAGGDPKRLVGKLSIDDAGAGGPRVEVEFEATLLKELTTAR